jgi:hypothetical protein
MFHFLAKRKRTDDVFQQIRGYNCLIILETDTHKGYIKFCKENLIPF